MTHREQLQDNYEDALFAIWMDDFAKRRGEELLKENERLQNDPAAAVPEHIHRRNLELIARVLRKNAHTVTLRAIGRGALRFVAAMLILVALFGCAYAASPQFRAGTLNLLMNLDERAASFQLSEDHSAAETPALMPNVTVGWLPEGYARSTPAYDRLQTTIDYTNGDGDLIRVRVFTESQTIYSLDVENSASCEDLIIHGTSGLLVKKDDLLRIMWADQQTNTYILVYSSSVDADTLLQVAENVSVSW